MRHKISTPTAQELFDLTNRGALSTSTSGHLGLALAAALAEAGCRVIVASRKMETAQKVAAASSSDRPSARNLLITLSMSFMPVFMLPTWRSVEMESGKKPWRTAGTATRQAKLPPP